MKPTYLHGPFTLPPPVATISSANGLSARRNAKFDIIRQIRAGECPCEKCDTLRSQGKPPAGLPDNTFAGSEIRAAGYLKSGFMWIRSGEQTWIRAKGAEV